VDSVRFVIKECDKGEEFWKGGGNHILEFFPRDTVELIHEVKEDGGVSGEGLFLLWAVDIFFNSKLHSFNDEVRAIENANGKVEGEEVGSKFVAKRTGHVSADEMAYCGPNAQGT
jgi:hypothetical protein